MPVLRSGGFDSHVGDASADQRRCASSERPKHSCSPHTSPVVPSCVHQLCCGALGPAAVFQLERTGGTRARPKVQRSGSRSVVVPHEAIAGASRSTSSSQRSHLNHNSRVGINTTSPSLPDTGRCSQGRRCPGEGGRKGTAATNIKTCPGCSAEACRLQIGGKRGRPVLWRLARPQFDGHLA